MLCLKTATQYCFVLFELVSTINSLRGAFKRIAIHLILIWAEDWQPSLVYLCPANAAQTYCRKTYGQQIFYFCNCG